MFTFVSDTQTLGPSGNLANTATVQIDQATDYAMRRRFFGIAPSSEEVTAFTVQVRTRNGSGYALDDDFLNTGYINNSPMPHDWDLAAGEQVFFDLQLVDFVGPDDGSVAVTCYLEGVKRGMR